jgi:hypothetical protein
VKHTFSSSVCLQNVVDYNPGSGNEPDFPVALKDAIESVSEVDIDAGDFPPFPGVPDNVMLEDFDRWTAGIVRGAWKVIATAAKVSLETPTLSRSGFLRLLTPRLAIGGDCTWLRRARDVYPIR